MRVSVRFCKVTDRQHAHTHIETHDSHKKTTKKTSSATFSSPPRPPTLSQMAVQPSLKPIGSRMICGNGVKNSQSVHPENDHTISDEFGLVLESGWQEMGEILQQDAYSTEFRNVVELCFKDDPKDNNAIYLCPKEGRWYLVAALHSRQV